jgi:hypothetical protein
MHEQQTATNGHRKKKEKKEKEKSKRKKNEINRKNELSIF